VIFHAKIFNVVKFFVNLVIFAEKPVAALAFTSQI